MTVAVDRDCPFSNRGRGLPGRRYAAGRNSSRPLVFMLLAPFMLLVLRVVRLRSLVLAERKAFGIAALGENFQKMARAQTRRMSS